MASPLVVDPGTRLMAAVRFGRPFFKMSGSGNHFVAFDAVSGTPGPPGLLPSPDAVRAICRRGVGVGADGIMILVPSETADYDLIHYNPDGSRAELCGNASLCSVRLAGELGLAPRDEVRFRTDSGFVTGRLRGSRPEIDLAPVQEVEAERPDLLAGLPDEERIGFARVGVPHVVVLCADARQVDIAARAPRLRHHGSLRDGANVNYVSPGSDGRWLLRTFERGVEEETLACGTGSVATALLLGLWGRAALPGSGERSLPTELVTASGEVLRVSFRRAGDKGEVVGARELTGLVGAGWIPSLEGSARIVYRGELGEGDW